MGAIWEQVMTVVTWVKPWNRSAEIIGHACTAM